MKTLTRLIAVLTLAWAGAAHSGATMTTIYWSGQCDDCAGNGQLFPNNPANIGDGLFQPVTGTLMLVDYVFGTPLVPENLLSFTYGGSSLVGTFTVPGPLWGSGGALWDIAGGFNPDGSLMAPGTFVLEWVAAAVPNGPLSCAPGICTFRQTPDTNWRIGQPPVDLGNAGTFSITPPIPLPSTLALFALGLLVMRRRITA